jgi:hypothetical protein
MMLRLWIGPVAVAFAATACSAAPSSEREPQSLSSASTTPPCLATEYALTDSNVVTWTPGQAVDGQVVHLVDDIYRNSNWAVVDPAQHSIKHVLAVAIGYRQQFYDAVVYRQAGGYCEGYGDFHGVSPCNPNGGSSGSGTCKEFYYAQTDPGSPSDVNAYLCLYGFIATTTAPECVAGCHPAACGVDSACGTMFDGCGGVLSCGSCSAGLSCIDNQCVNAHCRTGYRWCGVTDGCVKGSVCP